MKHLVTTLVLVFVATFLSAQSHYKAFQSELYKKDEYTGKWLLADQNKNVSIDIVSEKSTITIQAQSPTMYKLYPGSEEPLSTNSFTGSRFKAVELKNDISCSIDILVHRESTLMVISVVYSDYNLRFFIDPKDVKTF